jgi:hypothetical protein
MCVELLILSSVFKVTLLKVMEHKSTLFKGNRDHPKTAWEPAELQIKKKGADIFDVRSCRRLFLSSFFLLLPSCLTTTKAIINKLRLA